MSQNSQVIVVVAIIVVVVVAATVRIIMVVVVVVMEDTTVDHTVCEFTYLNLQASDWNSGGGGQGGY